MITSGSRTSKTGGQISAKIFQRPFFRSFPKNFSISPKSAIHLPKFLMTFFLVIDLFCVLYMVFFPWGGQIHSRQNHNTSIALSVPKGGPNSIANFDGGPWPDLPPLDPPLIMVGFNKGQCFPFG